ncbi:YkgJ family cysteine cluster protein [Thiovibrio sp. JS02]
MMTSPAKQQKIGAEQVLAALYSIHETWLGMQPWTCAPGCTSCCTQSVNITGLEGGAIQRFLGETGRVPKQGDATAWKRPGPGLAHQPLTTNAFARFCLAGCEPPEQPDNPWDLRPCPFLVENLCSIYPVRPMMCRAFVSKTNCAQSGSAEVPAAVVTGNTLFLQLVEHVASNGIWGNMLVVLGALAGEGENDARLARAETIPGFLIPPEDEAAMATIFKSLAETRVKGITLLQWLRQSGENRLVDQ